jgi:hypothetical protein
MASRTIMEIREELTRLMLEHAESLEKETFGGLSDEETYQQEQQIKRIREVSADYLSSLKRTA